MRIFVIWCENVFRCWINSEKCSNTWSFSSNEKHVLSHDVQTGKHLLLPSTSSHSLGEKHFQFSSAPIWGALSNECVQARYVNTFPLFISSSNSQQYAIFQIISIIVSFPSNSTKHYMKLVTNVLAMNSVISKYMYFYLYLPFRTHTHTHTKRVYDKKKTAPVLGNFTEEEANGSTLPQDTLEYPLQRDEVQTHHTKGERNNHQIPQSKFFFCYLYINIFCSFLVYIFNYTIHWKCVRTFVYNSSQ